MNISELLKRCKDQDIHLWVEGNRLKFRAQKGTLTQQLREQIAQSRDELIPRLRHQNAGEPGICELSYGQRALWFMQQTAPQNSAFNLAFAARICSSVDSTALKIAFQTLLDRHAALRTTFIVSDGLPQQRIHSYQEVLFQEIDATGWEEDRVQKHIGFLHRQPFHLETGPLVRVYLLNCSEQNHVLLLNIHHIVCDGWSFWIILDELCHIYQAEIKQQPLPIPLARAPYTKFVSHEKELLSGSAGDRLFQYWQEQLSEELPVLDLPLDKPRPKIQKFIGKSCTFAIESVLTAQIKQLAFSEEATLFVLLLSAFGILLHRHCGQERVVVGTPTFGRNRPEFENTVGCLINQVALLLDFTGKPDFKQFLAHTRKTVLTAMDNQDFPFHLVAENFWHNPDRSIPPICQAEFILQKGQRSNDLSRLFNPHISQERINFGDLLLENFPLEQQEGQLDLTLEIVESEGTLVGKLKFNAEIFDDLSITHMVDEYLCILENIVQNPQLPITAIPLYSAEEKHKILSAWSGSLGEDVLPISPLDRFATRVSEMPDAVALIHDQQSMTYNELGQRSSQLAQYLRASGIGPNVVVGLFCERSLEMIVALMAIMKSGGAYVPLDPSYPLERLDFMISDAKVSVVLTTGKLVERLHGNIVHTICVDGDWDNIDKQTPEDLTSAVQDDHLAYVIYTSGSTGTPKGVMIPRRALTNFVESAVRMYAIASSDKVLQFASINFDASVEEIFPCLAQGATLVLRTDTMLDSMEVFLDRCRAWGITVLDLPTAFWHELTLALKQDMLQLPESVRLVIIGGEKAHPETLAVWQAYVPPTVRLLNTYGPTEATVVATVCDLSAYQAAPQEMVAVPIGRPIANVQTYILDTHMQPVPVGVFGELHLGGAGLADGYLFRPDLTAQKFVHHPFSSSPHARLYKTGDLARYLPNGKIEYKGRIDSQVKIRGFRIETGEIESVLLEHPIVNSVHVMARQAGCDQSSLVAYFVTAVEVADTLKQLHEYLKQRLPEYMIPSAWVKMDRLPRTGSGKIDTQALPLPSNDFQQSGNEFVIPRTPIEVKMAEIWSEALNLNKISTLQDFFSIGGHSLLVLRVLSNIKKEWNVELSFRQFFETPTIAELAKFIETLVFLAEGSRAATVADIDRENVEI